MRDYSRDQATAKRIIERFYVKGHIKLVKGAATLDPVNGTVSGGGQSFEMTAVDLEIKKSLVDGTAILSTDRMVICDSSVRPAEGDRIDIGGKQYKAVRIMPLSPGGVDIYYRVACRG